MHITVINTENKKTKIKNEIIKYNGSYVSILIYELYELLLIEDWIKMMTKIEYIILLYLVKTFSILIFNLMFTRGLWDNNTVFIIQNF